MGCKDVEIIKFDFLAKTQFFFKICRNYIGSMYKSIIYRLNKRILFVFGAKLNFKHLVYIPSNMIIITLTPRRADCIFMYVYTR